MRLSTSHPLRPGRVVWLLLALALLLWLLATPRVAGAAEEKSRAETQAALEELDKTLKDMGRQNYYRYCAACHGLEARGHGIVANALSPKPPDLTRMAERRDGKIEREAIVKLIDGREQVAAHGSRDMPVWGERLGAGVEEGRREDVALGRIRAIVHYLLSIQQPEKKKKEPYAR